MIPVAFRTLLLNADGLAAAFDQTWQRPAITPVAVRRQGKRPIVTGVEMGEWTLPELGILIEDGEAAEALRAALLAAFDTRAGAGALIVADDDGGNERYMYVVCQALEQKRGQFGDGFVATLVATDDVYWQSVEALIVSTTMNDVVKTFTAANPGDVDTYPEVFIGESTSISGDSYWKYRRFCRVRWRAPAGADNYPVELSDGAGFNTFALIFDDKCDSESEFAVIVDGVEVDRWFGAASGVATGFNQTDTRIWTNLDFRAALTATLTADNDDEITVTGDISAWPATGILLIDSELFTYTGRDLYRRAFTGVSGAAFGSSGASHTTGATVEWIQHEIWLVYSTGKTAKTQDNARKPIFKLNTSDNATWEWADFGSLASPERAGQWTPISGGMGATFTGDENGAVTDPYQVMGLSRPAAGAMLAANHARWSIYLPCGLSAFDLTGDDYHNNGLLRAEVSPDGAAWQFTYASPGAAVDEVWDNWTGGSSSLATTLRYLALMPWNVGANDVLSQVTDADITFQSALRPTVAILSEQTNYQTFMLIDNLTTGEQLTVEILPGLRPGAEAAVINTEARTAIIDANGVNIYHGVSRDTLRPELLRLAPGNNSIRVSENPPANNQVSLTYRPRWYI